MSPEELLENMLLMNQAILHGLCTFDSEQEKRMTEQMQNCPYIEYEQDMGFRISFCEMDGQLCNGQCMR